MPLWLKKIFGLSELFMPFFSIIIPTKDSAKTLNIALESILRQSYSDFEILIIDGLSTDNTLEFAQRYNDERIKISSEKDNGIYYAMNKGIKLARGEWLYFLGSDDILYNPGVLQHIFIEVHKNNHSVIYGNVFISGDAGWAKDSQIYDGEFSLSMLINEKNICHQAIFYNKTVFETCGFYNTKYNICADWDFNLRLWANYSFYYIDIIIAVFNGGNSSCRFANNYDNTEKWLNIISNFKMRIISREFTPFFQNFLVIGKYHFYKKKFLKSLLLLSIFFLQKTRNSL